MLDAAAGRAGLSRDDYDELVVPDFDLVAGTRTERWGISRRDFAEDIKVLKAIADEIRTVVAAR